MDNAEPKKKKNRAADRTTSTKNKNNRKIDIEPRKKNTCESRHSKIERDMRPRRMQNTETRTLERSRSDSGLLATPTRAHVRPPDAHWKYHPRVLE
mmetsp:Transcript_25232/g.77791  ORF Transcript_25232/g.77791 Transcript_25232/m.77791 type:complete len:96 (+) Transcript_25232:1213-1500(+)